MNMKQNENGFTIIEIIIAIVVLTVGILGLVTTGALVTRMIARGQRSATAATYMAGRLERMRAGACVAGNRVNGRDTLYRGSNWVAFNTWSYTNAPNTVFRLKVVTTYKTTQNRVRSDSTESTVPCDPFN